MWGKALIAILSTINFLLLLQKPQWKLSNSYKDHLSLIQLPTSIPGKRTNCEISGSYLQSDLSKVVFSDAPPDSYLKWNLSELYTLGSPNEYIGYDQPIESYRYIDPEATLIYTTEYMWHNHFSVSEDFLCSNQIYNHVIGSQGLVSYKNLNKKIANYKAFDLKPRILQTVDLLDLDECQQFFYNFQGRWKLKSSDTNTYTELDSETIGDLSKYASKCPFSQKYAQRELSTAEFYLHCFVVFMPQPFRLFYYEAYGDLGGVSEFLAIEALKLNYGSEVSSKITQQTKLTIYHYFRMNHRSTLKHPFTFEVFKAKLLVTHSYGVLLVDVKRFHATSHYDQAIHDIYIESHIHAIELAYQEILRLPTRLKSNKFVEIF